MVRLTLVFLVLAVSSALPAQDEPPKELQATGLTLDGKRHGTWKFTDTSGTVQFEIEYVAGLKTGSFRRWDKSGKLIADGNMFADKRHGVWKEFYSSGVHRTEAEYFAGTMHGTWDSFYENGNPAERGACELGKRVGRWQGFHSGGSSSYMGEYEKGLRRGLWTFMHAGGATAEQGHFADDQRTGSWKEWDDQGRLVHDARYADGKVVAVSMRQGIQPKPGFSEVHLCALSDVSRVHAEQLELDGKPVGIATVRITRTGIPIDLVLCSRQAVQWTLDLEAGVILNRIVLGGLERQFVVNAPVSVPVEAKFECDGDRDALYPAEHDLRPRDPEQGDPQLATKVQALLGQVPATATLQQGGVSRFLLGRTAARAVVPPDHAELHALGVYEGTTDRPRKSREEVQGTVKVNVKRKGVPLVLFVCAYDQVKWEFNVDPGVDLRTVILCGYKEQEAAGLAESVTVTTLLGESGERVRAHAYKLEEFSARLSLPARDATGLEASSFQGAYQGKSFDISADQAQLPLPPVDAQLHVVCGGKGQVLPGKPDERVIDLKITNVEAALVLVLGSETDVTWRLEVGKNVRIERVILIGKGSQRIRGRPLGCKVQNLTEPVVGKDALKIAAGPDAPEVQGLKLKLKDQTGLEVDTIQADMKADAFMVP